MKVRVTRLGAGVVAVAIALGMAVWLGMLTLERRAGYYGPVWSPTGDQIYYFYRESRGFVIGLGIETFTPPAHVYMLQDRLTLMVLDPSTRTSRALTSFSLTPHIGRWTSRYHSGIFGWVSTRIEPVADGVVFSAGFSIPVVPSAETWRYRGQVFVDGHVANEGWQHGEVGATDLDATLQRGVEVLAIRGPEGYGKAIVAVQEGGEVKVVTSVPGFDKSSIRPEDVAALSYRQMIEHTRHFKEVESRLREKYGKQGMSEGAAALATYDEMEAQGLLPRAPRIVAKKIDQPPPGQTVFSIPSRYFDVGLFQDIAQAIKSPGEEVKSSTGDYLTYANDDVGARLKTWRQDHASFVVSVDGQLWLLASR